MVLNSINTRFSYERRVKLIILFAVMLAVSFAMGAAAAPSEEVYLPPERINLLRTSYSSDNYSVFEAQRNKISARGKYTGDRVRKLFIDKEDLELSGSYSMKAHDDGSYEAELTAVPADKGEHKLVVKLNSGALLRYFIFYDSDHGWYFPVNGYEQSSRKVFDHVYEAPGEAAALYLSPTKDAEEIGTALEQISMLAEQVTYGLETDYEKARAISRFVSEKVCYDMDAADTSVTASTVALCNVLKTARTVCAGFSNLFCAMAESVGIDAVNIKGGTVQEGIKYETLLEGMQNHEWAAFYYEEEQRWVWVDACWDGSGIYEKGERKDGIPKYMYFDISDEALALNHRADKAERRHYFEAKAETSILGAENDDGEKQSVITSQQTDEASPEPEEESPDVHPEPEYEREPETAPEQSDTVYIIIIAALAAAVAAVGAILIIIIVKGRKR